MYVSPEKYSHLIGTPYEEKDCWGIAVDFYKAVFDIELKSYYSEVPVSRDIAKNIIYSNMGDFKKVSEAEIQFGDIILIRLYGIESHIGIFVGDQKMLHTTLHSGCVIERITRWENLITGFYRVDSSEK